MYIQAPLPASRACPPLNRLIYRPLPRTMKIPRTTRETLNSRDPMSKSAAMFGKAASFVYAILTAAAAMFCFARRSYLLPSTASTTLSCCICNCACGNLHFLCAAHINLGIYSAHSPRAG